MAIRLIRIFLAFFAVANIVGCSEQKAEGETLSLPSVVVYSVLPEERIRPLLDAYASSSGARIHLVTGDFATLLENVHRPGSKAVADLFLAGNIADLWYAAEEGVFRPSVSESIASWIPDELRDPEHLWAALSVRARVIAINRNKVSEDEAATITDYASLAEERWRDRLCLSSSAVPGNGSTIAMLIKDHGVRDAELIARGWRANFALPPREDDEDLLEAISAGICDLGIADSDIVAAFQRKSSAVFVHLIEPPGVTSFDVTGAGVTRHANNPAAARELLEWLLGEQANARFAALQLEFPANPQAAIDDAIAAWAVPSASPVNLSMLGYLQEDAEKLAERARYP